VDLSQSEEGRYNTTDSGMLMPPCTELRPGPLIVIKLAHTIVWAFFASCIVAIPIASWRDEHRAAAWLIAIVFVEVLVLVLNRMRCPLTSLAARHTTDRLENFDIYLPLWLAKHNKTLFGALYIAGAGFALFRWLRASG